MATPGAEPLADTATAAAERLRERVVVQDRTWGAYHLEMTLEACCEWALATGDAGWLEPVQALWARREWLPGRTIEWRSQPFASHDDALARATGDGSLGAAFVAQTAAMTAAVPRDDEGLVVHGHRDLPPERRPLIIDFMHEYAARLASAAALGGDPAWFDEAVAQYRGYRAALRDPDTGLWHLGRDWGERPGTLSPGAWSRGHGWLLRGLVEVLRWLPAAHAGRAELAAMLHDLLGALRPLQDATGMWHVCLHRDHAASEPETSGTALIAHAVARAIHDGHLARDEWQPMAERAIAGVCTRVDEAGIVHGACRGPGLLFDDGEALYRGRAIEADDPHGAPCALYACLAPHLLEARPAPPPSD